ncbi:MAG TPA: hypothetical protein PKW95_23950 [bacterium]|nr:hypothetical protein [bacterium]
MSESKKPTIRVDDDGVVVHIPMKFKRRGGRKEIIVPLDCASTTPEKSPVQRPLVVALARAFRWQELLETGKVASIAALAKRLKVDRAYVSRILGLTLLAPDIVRAIMDGDEPSGLSLARLTKPFPVLWEDQRRIFR